jgi:hypothetical protein
MPKHAIGTPPHRVRFRHDRELSRIPAAFGLVRFFRAPRGPGQILRRFCPVAWPEQVPASEGYDRWAAPRQGRLGWPAATGFLITGAPAEQPRCAAGANVEQAFPFRPAIQSSVEQRRRIDITQGRRAAMNCQPSCLNVAFGGSMRSWESVPARGRGRAGRRRHAAAGWACGPGDRVWLGGVMRHPDAYLRHPTHFGAAARLRRYAPKRLRRPCVMRAQPRSARRRRADT